MAAGFVLLNLFVAVYADIRGLPNSSKCDPSSYDDCSFGYNNTITLNLFWDENLHAHTLYNYTVYWKDEPITNFPVINPVYDCKVSLMLNSITIGADDDLKVIRFVKSTDKQNSNEEKLVTVKYTGYVSKTSNLEFYIPIIGVVGALIIICAIVTIFVIKKKMPKIPLAVTDDNYYKCFENDLYIPDSVSERTINIQQSEPNCQTLWREGINGNVNGDREQVNGNSESDQTYSYADCFESPDVKRSDLKTIYANHGH